MAELGQTQNPRELVPGEPETVEENARMLRTRAANGSPWPTRCRPAPEFWATTPPPSGGHSTRLEKLTALSATGEGLGVALDATGVGAVAGVPLNAVSAAGIATGATITGVAMANITSHAAGDDHVSPMNTDEDSGTGGSGPPSENPPGVKPEWSSRAADNGKGTVYQQPGSAGNANMVRIMEPTPQYPNGYVRFYNEQGQPVGLDGKSAPNSATHIPKATDGSYPVPEGW